MTNKKDDTAAERAREYYDKRVLRAEMVADGQMPSLHELLSGFEFARGDLEYDARLFFKYALQHRDTDHADLVTAAASEIVETGYDIKSITQARTAFDAAADVEGALRCLVYIACSIDNSESRGRLISHLAHRLKRRNIANDPDGLNLALVQVGLLTGQCDSMSDYLLVGVDRAREIDIGNGLLRSHRDDEGDLAEDVDHDIMDQLAAVAEDRAEIGTKKRQGSVKKSAGIIVVPNLGSAVADSRSTRRETAKLWRELHGQPLPLAMRGDVMEQRSRLADRHPHAVDAINAVFADVGTSEHVSFRPTLLVGRTGSGKSELMTAIANALGVPSEPVSLAGSADGSVMGTSAQWSTSGESVPLQAIRKNKIANPIVAWDEIDKAVSSHNGYALDAMLPMLEYSTAKSIRDPALEVPVDISWVSHIATANELHKIPKTLLNRFRVIEIPWPKREHISGISRGLIEQIANRRRHDRRFYPPLTPDEIDMVARFWRGGSIRNLVPVVEAVIDSREIEMGRA